MQEAGGSAGAPGGGGGFQCRMSILRNDHVCYHYILYSHMDSNAT